MPNAILKIAVAVGREIEVIANDVLRFEAQKLTPLVQPGVLAAMVVLVQAVARVGTDVVIDGNNPLAILLGGAQQAQDVMALLPDTKAFLETLGVKFNG